MMPAWALVQPTPESGCCAQVDGYRATGQPPLRSISRKKYDRFSNSSQEYGKPDACLFVVWYVFCLIKRYIRRKIVAIWWAAPDAGALGTATQYERRDRHGRTPRPGRCTMFIVDGALVRDRGALECLHLRVADRARHRTHPRTAIVDCLMVFVVAGLCDHEQTRVVVVMLPVFVQRRATMGVFVEQC